MTRDSLGNAAIVVLSVCALLSTGLLIRRELSVANPSPPSFTSTIDPLGQREATIATSGGHPLSAAATARVVVEFADYECSACLSFESNLHRFLHDHASDVRVVFRNFPLTAIHPQAMAAATAAECAASQGRFVEMHDLLYKRQSSLGIVPWWSLARVAGVRDSARFASCLASTDARSRIDLDIEAGRHIGVRGTPTIVVGERRVTGVVTPETLDSLLRLTHTR